MSDTVRVHRRGGEWQSWTSCFWMETTLQWFVIKSKSFLLSYLQLQGLCIHVSVIFLLWINMETEAALPQYQWKNKWCKINTVAAVNSTFHVVVLCLLYIYIYMNFVHVQFIVHVLCDCWFLHVWPSHFHYQTFVIIITHVATLLPLSNHDYCAFCEPFGAVSWWESSHFSLPVLC